MSIYAYTIGEDNVCHFPEPEEDNDRIGWVVHETIGIGVHNPLGIIRGFGTMPMPEEANIRASIIG